MSNTKEEHKWADFDALVTWAAWQVMEGLTTGTPLRSVVFKIITAARCAEFKGPKK